jgi:hypothetical protein
VAERPAETAGPANGAARPEDFAHPSRQRSHNT